MRALLTRDTGIYLLAFYAVLAVWRVRRVQGDVWLLAGVHLLTAIGFALLAEPRPIRCATPRSSPATRSGSCLGLAVMAAASLVDFRKATLLAFELRAARRRAAAVAVVVALRRRARHQPRQRQPRAGSADRGDSSAARLLPRRLLRATLGAAAAGAQPADRLASRARAGCTCRAPSTCVPVVVGVGAALMFFALQTRPRSGAVPVVRVPRDVCRRARPRRHAARGAVVLLLGFAIGYQLNISTR